MLGAGSSISFGYPVGADLTRRLIELKSATGPLVTNSGLLDDRDLFYRFLNEFMRSQMYSIDAFLARRPEYGEIGKKSIATILLSLENSYDLVSKNNNDHWAREFFNKIAADSWNEIDLSAFSIITFNYDIALENFLIQAFKHSFGKSDKEVFGILKNLEIIHVYGSLGTCPLPGYEGLSYGEEITRERVAAAASGIKVIPEGRNEDKSLQRARQLLSEAKALAFLGFGFDKLNLERLESKQTCCASIKRANSSFGRIFLATCLGMTQAEVLKAAKATYWGEGPYHGAMHSPPPVFRPEACLQAIRESGFFL